MIETEHSDETQLRQLAQRRVQAKIGFFKHAGVYAVVNMALLAANLVTSPGALWFFWPLIGWGIGLAAHGISVYVPGIGDNWLTRFEEREFEKLRRRKSGNCAG